MSQEFADFNAKYDLNEQQERFREKERRHTRAVKRWQAAVVAFIAFGISGGVVGVSYIIWQGTKGPSAGEQIEEKVREDCIAAKGSWIFLSTADGTKGTCLFGKVRP